MQNLTIMEYIHWNISSLVQHPDFKHETMVEIAKLTTIDPDVVARVMVFARAEGLIL